MFLQIFAKQLNEALNCCTFVNNNTAICGGDKGEIIMVDLRNTRYRMLVIKVSGKSGKSGSYVYPTHTVLPNLRTRLCTYLGVLICTHDHTK